MGEVASKYVALPPVTTEVMSTSMAEPLAAAASAAVSAVPKLQAAGLSSASAETLGDVATSTAMICANGDSDGVGDGVVDDVTLVEGVVDGEMDVDALTEPLIDDVGKTLGDGGGGSGVGDRDALTDCEAARLADDVRDGDGAFFEPDGVCVGDGDVEAEAGGGGGGAGPPPLAFCAKA